MTADAFGFLFGLALVGGMLILGLLGVREADQRQRDAHRGVITVRFPRKVTAEQTLTIVRSIIGLGSGRGGLLGRVSVALEVVGTAEGITHRMRLPANSSDYLISQLRAAMPGLAVEAVETFRPEQCGRAIELRRLVTDSDLAIADAAAVSLTILAAVTDLRPGEAVVWQLVLRGGLGSRPTQEQQTTSARAKKDGGVVAVAIRLGAAARHRNRANELVARLLHAASSVSAPGARLVPRGLTNGLVAARIARAATPSTEASAVLTPKEAAALWGAPVGTPLLPGLTVGGSPQLPADIAVPTTGRVLGRATADGRSVAQPVIGAREHTLILGPTGVGKSWLAARLLLEDVAAGRGALLIDPKGSTAKLVLERLDEGAVGRTVIIDLTDEGWTVPLPLLTAEAGGIPELAADTLVGLLRHRYRDLGPRSTDILTSSLYALGRTPDPNLLDLLRLWTDGPFRTWVTNLVQDDPVLASFFGWFNGLNHVERSFVLAAPMNKIRPLM
jgi:hypothetical protein